MKNNKILIRINNLDEINDYQKESINNFLFALDGFSIGYPSFSLNELGKLDCNVYLLLNRVLNNDGISYYIPFGWIALEWKSYQDEPHFVR